MPSEPLELKPMPLAAVIYFVTFAEDGTPSVQGKIHADTAGRQQFTGDASRCYTMASTAQDLLAKRLAVNLTDAMTRAAMEKRLLAQELETPTAQA